MSHWVHIIGYVETIKSALTRKVMCRPLGPTVCWFRSFARRRRQTDAMLLRLLPSCFTMPVAAKSRRNERYRRPIDYIRNTSRHCRNLFSLDLENIKKMKYSNSRKIRKLKPHHKHRHVYQIITVYAHDCHINILTQKLNNKTSLYGVIKISQMAACCLFLKKIPKNMTNINSNKSTPLRWN